MKIALLGDIGQFGRFNISENKNLYNYFRKVEQLLAKQDVVIGNLETPFSETNNPLGAKSAHIYSDKNNASILKYLHINYVNLANNHIFDYGLDSYELTKRILKNSGIEYFGVESKQVYIEIENVKLALHGYCSHNTNPQQITFNESIGINGLDVDLVKKNIESNTDNGYFNIVSIHSGQEHVNYPSLDDIQMAKEFSEVSSYVYYGHHPHVVQGVDSTGDSVIAYSLGNFCFSDVYTEKSKEPLIKMSENNKTGLILLIELNEDGISSYETVSIYMGAEEMEVNLDFANKQLENYSNALTMNAMDYDIMRNSIINKYITSRKVLRNFKWYVKRLNFNSILQIINSKLNQNKYKKYIKSKLR
jgi:poly-gamma-glutamate synthesis protein (capsule biosynthesis protein)